MRRVCQGAHDKLERVRARCVAPEQHLVLAFDMTAGHALGAQVDRALAQLGHIDMLISDAGVSQRSLVEDTAVAVGSPTSLSPVRAWSERRHVCRRSRKSAQLPGAR